MTGAHTEGPWLCQAPDDDGMICIVGANLGGLVGAALCWPTEVDTGGSDRVRANAALITAAPELLAQLEYAVKLLGALPTLNGTAQVQSMRDTIAKARTPLPSGSIER